MTARRSLRLALLTLLGCAPLAATIRLHETAEAWGLAFRHHHGGSGARYMVETMAGGVVLLDYDGDGDDDVFLVDGGLLPGYQGDPPESRLFRNDGGGHFVDRTVAAGIVHHGYGFGATAGDVDGDGFPDLFISGFGADTLWRNRGDGTFADITAEARVSDPLWSAGAAFADTDGDGDLDLFVASYVDFTLDNHKFCGDRERGLRGYCSPDVYNGLPAHFYRNLGNGLFEDATAAAGLGGAVAPGLGVTFADLDQDGWPDLYVANDLKPNFLFRNRGDGTFEDVSLLSGASYGDRGRPEAGMGIAVEDYDQDGRPDVAVSNFELETNALYRNLGEFTFLDSRHTARIAEPSLLFLGWGMVFEDLDLDGDLELVVANGHINDNAAELLAGSKYRQRNQVFENLGDGRFSERLDSGLDIVLSSRGLAAGDLDGDGDAELVILNSNDLAEVYENTGATGDWLLVDLAGGVGRGSNPAGIGAELELSTGTRRQVREVRTGSSYLSQHSLTARFGLGANATTSRLRVRWPRGAVQEFHGLAARRRYLVVAAPR